MAEENSPTALQRALATERANARTWEQRSKRNRNSLDYWRGRAARLQDELRETRNALDTLRKGNR